MRIIETKANTTEDHLLSIQLPEDIEVGQYKIAIIIDSQPKATSAPKSTQPTRRNNQSL